MAIEPELIKITLGIIIKIVGGGRGRGVKKWSFSVLTLFIEMLTCVRTVEALKNWILWYII